MPKPTHFFAGLTIFIFGLFIFTIGLASQEIIGFDSRFYLFAQEMLQQGITFFPTTYHIAYPDYIATSTLLIVICAHVFGVLNKFTAILPTALAASGTLLITYQIGAKRNPLWGWYAVCCLLLTLNFFQLARSISLDMQLTFITSLAFFSVSSTEENSYWQKYGIYLLMILGFALRGPIGLIIPTGVICTYYLLALEIKKSFYTGIKALVLLTLCTIILLLAAYMSGGFNFLHDVLRMQFLGRMDEVFLPYYFYIYSGFSNYAISFPLAILSGLGIIFYRFYDRQTHAEWRFCLQLIGWFTIILIGMSIPGEKKTRYILPLIPAASLLTAYIFIAPNRQKFFLKLQTLLQVVFFILPSGGMLLLAIAYFMKQSISTAFLPIIFVLLVLQILNIVIKKFLHKNIFYSLINIFIASITFCYIDLAMIEPIAIAHDQAKVIVEQIEDLRAANHAPLLFYKIEKDGLAIKYLIHMSHAQMPTFIKTEKQLFALSKDNQPHLFITLQTEFTQLNPSLKNRLIVLMQAKFSHVAIVVFKTRVLQQ